MKKLEMLFILSIISSFLISINCVANAEDGVKIINDGYKLEANKEIKNPSNGFILDDTNTNKREDINIDTNSTASLNNKKNIKRSKLKAASTTSDDENTIYTSGNYQYKIEKDYRITKTDRNWTIISDEKEDIAKIIKYTGNESTVTIPSTLGGKRVYKIEDAAFYKNTSITKLIIPDNTVGYIGEGAFADCTNLADVSLGNSLDNISYYAFQNTAIKSINLPENLEAIRGTTFFHCKNLTSITLNSKNVHLKVVDNVIYEYYHKYRDSNGNSGDFGVKLTLVLYPDSKKNTTFTIPDDVDEIQYQAILNDYIETINIPAKLSYIWLDDFAFLTPNLKNINVSSSNETYSSINGVLFSKDKKKLCYYPSGRKESTYSIPSGTAKIGGNSIYGNDNLKNIVFPNTLKEIETYAFWNDNGLTEMTIPSSVTEMGAQIIKECSNLKKVTINANTDVLPYLTFSNLENLEEVVINGNTKEIIKYAFDSCENLSKVTLPNSLEKIDSYSFYNCPKLKNVTIPQNVLLIEKNAFSSGINFDISKTQLKKQSDGSYIVAYDYTVKGTRDYEKAYEVLDIVNQERKKVGLNELTMDKELLETAMKRASEIVTYFEHERPNGKDCFSLFTKSAYFKGENIAAGNTTASSVMNSWMNSPGHKQNILTSYYTCIGIGCYKADNGNYYWTQAFTNGTPTTLTKPQNINATEKISILNNRVPFGDVKKNEWYFNAVKYNVSNNIILGYNSSTFAPNDKLSRAMMVTILYRMEGNPKVSGSSKFSDVSTDTWYSNAIKWATDNKIVSGYSGTNKFGPNNNILRQDVAVILNNYTKYKKKNTTANGNLTKFKDSNKVDSYANYAMKWAVGHSVITGNSNGTLNPKGNATRAEAAAMIQKYCYNVGR